MNRSSRPGTTVRLIAVLCTIVCGLALTMLGTAGSAQAATRTFTGISVTANGAGYALIAGSGETYAFGNVTSRGNPTGFSDGIAGIGVTRDGGGYAAVSGRGQVYAFGNVAYRGNADGSSGIVGISVTADGQGYVAVSNSGQVYAFGTAAYRGNATGSTGGIKGISVTADGQGYVVVSGTGQVYAFGTTAYRGNATGSSGIVGISVTSNGQGYVAVSNSGQVYAFGTTTYRGNASGFSGGIKGISVTADGQGYALVSGIGQVYAFGTVTYRGNGDPGSSTAATYAAEILANPSISKTGRLVREDLQAAAEGRNGTANAPLSATMLGLIAQLGHSHRLTINALESGGTGHCNNTPKASCPTNAHYTGHGVDFGPTDGATTAQVTGRDPGSMTIINGLKGQLPAGSRFGQIRPPRPSTSSKPLPPCSGSVATLPAGVTQIEDTCNHLHMDLPVSAP